MESVCFKQIILTDLPNCLTMTPTLLLTTGSIIGALLGYFMAKAFLLKNFISRELFDKAESELSKLRIENATRISKDELLNSYVSRELFVTVEHSLSAANEDFIKKEEESDKFRDRVIQLTAESEQKLSKEEIEKNYVAMKSFEIVNRKLTAAEDQLRKRDDTILQLNNDLTELRKEEEHLNDKLNTFKSELEELHKLSQEKFKNLASDVLEEKKKHFVDENKKELNTILDPFKNDLNQFKQKVEATRKEDIQDLTSLKKEIEALQKLNIQLSDDAKNLATALKSEVKMQGSWGEDRLNMILEVEGLQKYIDYSREETYKDHEQEMNRRPDFILRLPNRKHIVIDSKVSLTAYVNYFNASSTQEKIGFLQDHLRSVMDHIDRLADKNYQSLAGLSTPDYVFMFMPVESALTLALNQNPEIFNSALRRKIVLITPTTLVATLKVVKLLWQKENQVKNVEEIFRQCGELYNKFVSFLEDMDKIDNALNTATKAHRDAMNSLKDGTRKGNTIIGRFESIKKLEAKTNKQIPDKLLAEIELLPSDEDDPSVSSSEGNGMEGENEINGDGLSLLQ
jgi:DNA recombination protein RmuC